MAETPDDSQKTEEPSQKRLDDARRKGQVVVSQEVKHGAVLLGGLVIVMLLGPPAARELAAGLGGYLGSLDAVATDPGAVLQLLRDGTIRLALLLLPPFLILMVFAAAGTLLQTGPLASASNLAPKFEKISPAKGLKRLFSTRALVDFLKGLLKLGIAGGIGFWVVWPEFSGIDQFSGLEPAGLLARTWDIVVRMLMAMLAVVAGVAGLDYLYQRHQFLKQHRMSKQEVKEEYKQAEGDPVIKGRLRQLRLERAKRRMMAAVPGADVVITNPTHFAIALSYDPAAMGAPRVVAKGVDAVALRIREVAEAHGVAVVENPPLARALYPSIEIDQEIPPEHYKAVAEVISYVFKLQQRRMPAAPPAGAR